MSQLLAKGMSCGYVSPILRNISFKVEQGQHLALCGPNGSGKTTVLKTLRGIIKEASGEVFIDNRSMPQKQRLLSSSLSFLSGENVGAWPDLTLKENFFFLLSCRGFKKSTIEDFWNHLSEILLLRNLADRLYSTCSMGERKALHLSTHLASVTEQVLLLDEPLAHLDETRALGFLKFSRDRKLTGITSLQSPYLEKWRDHFDDVLDLGKS